MLRAHNHEPHGIAASPAADPQRMVVIGRAAASVVHDVKNLLMAAMAQIDVMKMRLEPGHPVRADAERLQKLLLEAAGVTRPLLHSTRTQPQQVVALGPFLDDLMPLVTCLMGARTACHYSIDDHTASLCVDASALERALLNLVLNAREAMPGGGRLEIQAASEPRGVALSVRDTGVGMDDAQVRSALDADAAGVGLSDVCGFAAGIGGFVELQSEPGLGTTVTLHLPLVDVTG